MPLLGLVIGRRILQVTDPNGDYIAYSVCNLHDVVGDARQNSRAPGPWAEKITVHTPRVTSAGPGQVWSLWITRCLQTTASLASISWTKPGPS